MSDTLTSLLGCALAAGATFLVTPAMITVARRTDFLDHPIGYKGHRQATPYLGGTAVLVGLLCGLVLAAGEFDRLWPILAGVIVLWALGTTDDRIAVPPKWRLLVEAGIAALLFEKSLGWSVTGSDALDLALTVLWVIAIVNAVNLMDNLDGAGATVAATCLVGAGTFALVYGDFALGATASAGAGACVGFLPRNLAKPARIFLGDGGSMTLGFLVAATAMGAAQAPAGDDGTALLAAGLLAALPMLDTTLVMLSRTRRGVSILTGGRDHLTHRLLGQLGSPLAVAVALACAQLALLALALAGQGIGPGALAAAGAIAAAAGIAAIAVLESERWRPEPVASESRPSDERRLIREHRLAAASASREV
jgi:UDP-GlcNAc:undecaprenyl-phosphate GlcNAc-1-phosphate transferase